MTTIALDGNTIAADRQLTIDTEMCVSYGCPKILKRDDHIFSVCGTPVLEAAVRWYLEGDADITSPLLPGGTWELIVWDGEKWASWDNDVRGNVPFKTPMAFGSGAKYAMGAMLAGKSAVKAVEIASLLDPFTGQGIDKIRYR